MLVLISLFAASAWACSVPVFRYALEHWVADPFQLVVFHRGELTPAQRAQVQALKPERANTTVMTADVAGEMSPDHAELWKQQKPDVALPRVALRYPRSSGVSTTPPPCFCHDTLTASASPPLKNSSTVSFPSADGCAVNAPPGAIWKSQPVSGTVSV